jgi:quercetin dioxygenase-like cupin family protein
MTEFVLAKGSQILLHKHQQEQTGYLVSGHRILFIGNEVCEMHPGDSRAIAGDVEHRVEILAGSIAIEVFAPRREDFLSP